MKAVQFDAFGASDVLHLTDLPNPAPANDELLVRVSAAGVSYVDVRQREGAYNRAETRVGGVKLPSTPGMQAVGRVVAVGPAADRSLVGRKVVAFVDGGAYAELMIAPHGLYVTVPDGVDEAVGLTAYFALTASTTLRRGESVLVHAAGSGVGSLAVQIAKILGSGKVIGTASSAEKRAHILELRADHAIDYTATNWPQSVLDVTQGKGVDVLLESIGGKVFEQNFECLATFGRYVLLGSTQGLGKDFAARRLMTKCQSIAGIYVPVFMSRPDLVREGLKFMVEHVAAGDLKMRIDRELPLNQAAEAQKLLEDRKVTGAVVLRP